MSMAWFRSYHGAPFDAKHVTVAKRSDTQPGVSCAVWWALLDYASQHEDRGSVAGFDCEIAADFFGWGVETVARVVQVMGEVGLISDHRIANWDKRQVQRERPEDHSSERVRRYREKHVTPRNAMKRHETLVKRSVTQTPKNRSSDVAETVATAAAQATATQDDSACNATKRHETPRVDKRRVDKELLQKPVRERPERETWLSPCARAWERRFGVGAFESKYGEAAKFLGPIHAGGATPSAIGLALGNYCDANKLNRFMSIKQFAQHYQRWSGPLWEDGWLTELGMLVTAPPSSSNVA